MSKRKVRSITVIGRKWFDSANGNTYHTTRVLVNGEVFGTSEMQYGYGDHYIQSAAEMIKGIVKREYHESSHIHESLRLACERLGIAYHAEAHYGKKSDLH